MTTIDLAVEDTDAVDVLVATAISIYLFFAIEAAVDIAMPVTAFVDPPIFLRAPYSMSFTSPLPYWSPQRSRRRGRRRIPRSTCRRYGFRLDKNPMASPSPLRPP